MTVILDEEAYHTKMIEHLACGSYKLMEKDPSTKILREVTKEIKESALEDNVKKNVTPSNALMPCIYVSPKIHRKEIPLRPIVNTIGSPTYLLAKFLAKTLLPLSR